MKKKHERLSMEFKYPVLLFREDLEEIEEIFRNDLSASKIEIEIGSYVADSCEEIPIQTAMSNSLKFYSREPYFVLNINAHSPLPNFSADNNTVVLLGVADKIQLIFKNRARRILFWTRRVVISIWIVSIPSFWIMPFLLKNFILIWILVAILWIIIWSIVIYVPVKSKIIFSKKIESKNFWQRNKDELFRDLIVGIFCVTLGFLLGYFIK